jgi:hypothetical protein
VIPRQRDGRRTSHATQDSSNRPFPIAVAGLDSRRLNTLEKSLAGPVDHRVVIALDTRARAAIVDLDAPGADDELAAQRARYPHRPLILLALLPIPPKTLRSDIQVLKPIQVPQLVEALAMARSRALILTGRRKSSAGPAPVAKPGPLPTTHYDPRRYLQGLVTRACQAALTRSQAVHVAGLWPTITLLPNLEMALLPGGLAALSPHAGVPGLLSDARLTFSAEPRLRPSHPNALPLDTLIWHLALAASRGRLPTGTPLDHRCSLREWPDFSRLAPTPEAMSIAELWTRNPLSLLRTAEMLRLPEAYVFSFYSAAHALGLVT